MLERLNEDEIVRYLRHLYFLDCMEELIVATLMLRRDTIFSIYIPDMKEYFIKEY